jgi:hypothetical protein
MMGHATISQTARTIVKADLTGAWSLERYTETVDDGEVKHPLGLNPNGLLIYTEGGSMSALLMSGDRSLPQVAENDAGTEVGRHSEQDGFVGYSGEYHFDEVGAIVYHTPSVSFDPRLIGQRLKRQVELDGDRLTLTVVTSWTPSNSIKSSLCWLRIHPKPSGPSMPLTPAEMED